jgi:MFS family permease
LNKHYRNVWGASFVSNVGNWMEMVGVQWTMAQATLTPEWVASHRPGAPIMMGYLASAQMAPILILGLIGGIVADRVDRRNLLIVTQFLMMLVAAALCVTAFRGGTSPITLIVLGLLNGIAVAFNLPAWGVLTPRLVPRADLADAIVLNGLQFNMARVVGPAAAGLLMGWLGAPLLFLINSLSFVVVIVAVALTPKAPPPPHDGSRPWQQIAEAFRFAFLFPGPRALVLAILIFSLLGTPLLRMMPIIVSEVYHEQADSFGLLLAVMGGGAVTGALTIKRVPPWYPRHHLIPLSVLLGGITTGLTAAAPSLLLASFPMFICGLFWMWTFNSSFAALQILVDDRMRGRVMAITNVLSFGAMPVGALICGGIGEYVSGRKGDGFGTQIGMICLGAALACAGIVMLTWRTPEVDGLRPGDPGFDRKPGLIRGFTATAHRRDVETHSTQAPQ